MLVEVLGLPPKAGNSPDAWVLSLNKKEKKKKAQDSILGWGGGGGYQVADSELADRQILVFQPIEVQEAGPYPHIGGHQPVSSASRD